MFALLFTIFCVVLIYHKIIKPYNYWKERGVSQIKPWPIIGNFGPYAMKQTTIVELICDLYNAHPERRYDGIYQLLHPTLFIRDLELIKLITVKEFDSFSDIFMSRLVNDNLVKRTLPFLGRETGWQHMRSMLSPTFTGSKMKMIFSCMEECAERVVNYYMEAKEDVITVDVMNTCNRITNDVIASVAFGIQCDSLKNPENEFYLMGRKSFHRSALKNLAHIISNINPVVEKLLNVRAVSAECEDFFFKIIKETIKYRQENNIGKPDMLHMLLEGRKNIQSVRTPSDVPENADDGFAAVEESELTANKKVTAKLSDEDITAQGILFFLAGFESSAIALSHLSYELAVNPDIQQRLQNEIAETIEKFNGKITYEGVVRMKYLDAVVSESFRLRTLGPFINRRATKPFTIEPERPGEVPIHLKEGDSIWIPVCALHLNPKYFPNPLVFDPERFSDRNKHKIIPNTYMPFGSGPRSCIASRFVLLQIKNIIVNLLNNFNIVPVEKTEIPMKLEPGAAVLMPKNGIWLGFEKRR